MRIDEQLDLLWFAPQDLQVTPNNAMKRTSAPVTTFAYAKEPPGDSRRLSRR